MHQVITVSLGNNHYQMEEDAHASLRRYFHTAQIGLKNDPGVNEVLGDLERSIAEKCAAILRPGKSVISSEEMAQILREIGPVTNGAEGIGQDETTGAGKIAAAAAPQVSSPEKRGLRPVHVVLIAVIGLLLLFALAVLVPIALNLIDNGITL